MNHNTRGDPVAAESVIFPPLARSFFTGCFPRIKNALPLDFDADATTRDLIETVVARSTNTTIDTGMPFFGRADGHANTCIIAVPGPSLEERVDALFPLIKNARNREAAIIAVDGAARLFMERDIFADIVVTDLDGLNTIDVIKLHDTWHSTIVVHGHGNNQQAVLALLERANLDGKYIFTTQVEPTRHVCNLGGFTDGDRAVFIGIALGFTRLVLVAMDLQSSTIGRYSKPGLSSLPAGARSISSYPIKERKIRIATSILRWLAREAPPGCALLTFQQRPPLAFLDDLDRVEDLAR